jgi:hypothetical protein
MKNQKSLEQLFEREVNERWIQGRGGLNYVSSASRLKTKIPVNDTHIIKKVETPEVR